VKFLFRCGTFPQTSGTRPDVRGASTDCELPTPKPPTSVCWQLPDAQERYLLGALSVVRVYRAVAVVNLTLDYQRLSAGSLVARARSGRMPHPIT
jgi:hypothetical protein